MYKQITLMLVGSLILLSQIGITTIIPNAMGIADYDNADKYMKYAEDMTNKNYQKSHSDLLHKIKCNNINANLNNIDANIGISGPVQGDTTDANGEVVAAQGGEALSTNGARNSVERTNNFSVECINNNNNIRVEGEEPISRICEECFAANSTFQTELANALVEFNGAITVGMPFASSVLNIYPGTNTIQQLCDIIETSTQFYGGPVTDIEVFFALSAVLTEDIGTEPTSIDALLELIDCLLEAGIIVEGDPTTPVLFSVFIPSDSISVTGTNEINVMCTNNKGCIDL